MLEERAENYALFFLLLFIALGVWNIVHYGMLLGRTNIAQYNKDAADEFEIEDIVNAQVDAEVRDALLTRKRHGKNPCQYDDRNAPHHRPPIARTRLSSPQSNLSFPAIPFPQLATESLRLSLRYAFPARPFAKIARSLREGFALVESSRHRRLRRPRGRRQERLCYHVNRSA